ncbi:MAG TPA: hypothetical protein VIN73_06120 [Vicingaceae bacterium]
MTFNPKTQKRKSLTLYYLEEDEQQFISYLCFAICKANSGNKIPARVIMKLYELHDKASTKHLTKIFELIQKTFDFFNNRYYNFSGKWTVELFKADIYDLDKPNNLLDKFTHKNYKYGLLEMITTVVSDTYPEHHGKIKKIHKDDCFIAIYDAIESYILNFCPKKVNKILTTYKKQVIAAYIATLYGYDFVEKKKLSKKNLFQNTRNSLKKRGNNNS